MTVNERLMQQGLLAEKRGELRKLENQAENHLNALRVATFVQDSPLDLDGGNIVAAANDLNAVLAQAAIVQKRIAELENALGI
jgi:hypothetical protein